MANQKTPDNRGQQEDLPGYPHYPANEDILNPDNGFRKAEGGDVEDLANSNAISRRVTAQREQTPDAIEDPADDDDLRIVKGTEADVTPDDLIALGSRETDQDM